MTSERVPISSKPSNLDCRDSGESFDAHIVAVCKIFEKGRGFCRAPCLAVGLLYTCILQGARQAQGPCCTNPISIFFRSLVVRRTSLTTLIHLLQEDYLKMSGSLFFRILHTISDENDEIVNLTKFYIQQRLLKRKPKVM